MEEDSKGTGLGNVIRIDDDRIRDHLGKIVRGSVEETLNALLEAEADIDNRDSRVLSAGLCIEDSGGTLDLRNDREDQAVINYRSMPASSNW